MVIIKPFKGLRPKDNELAGKIAALPYDVMNREEAKKMAQGNPLSFLHVSRAEIDLPDSVDPYDMQVYLKAKETLARMIEEGYFIQDKMDSFYLYRQIMNNRAQVGIIGTFSIDDYFENRIKKHELTRAAKEEDRMKHIDITNTNNGQVFLTYRDVPSLNAFLEKEIKSKPLYDFTAEDGIRHTVWVISDPGKVRFIVEEFSKIPCVYIADGHHRAASSAKVGLKRRNENKAHTGKEEYNFFMATIFPAGHLKILDYNRVVKDLNGNTVKDFLKKVSEKFEVSKAKTAPYSPAKPKEVGMYLDKQWYVLSMKKGTYDEKDPIDSLDVQILQNNLLAPILGIKDPRKDERIDFVGGIRGLGELERLVDSGKFRVAFSMYPVSLEELMAIADAGKIMPPKSTWFEPKLRSGLVLHLLS